MLGLGDLTGGLFSSRARAASSDGSVVVGTGTSALGNEAFVWEADTGMRSIASVLQERGLDLGGWRLTEANGISADGRIVVGTGVNPSGATEAWLALLGDDVVDADGDGILDEDDVCPDVADPEQADLDGDGMGDACDADDDGDGVDDAVDNCAQTMNADQADFDGDASGDACDSDDDGDGVPDETDNCACPRERRPGGRRGRRVRRRL